MLIKISSLITFTWLAIWKGIPFYRWAYVWCEINAFHEAEIRKAVWELKKEGRIREDENGLLWTKEEEDGDVLHEN